LKVSGNRLYTFVDTRKISDIIPEVKPDKKATEVKMETTIELYVNT